MIAARFEITISPAVAERALGRANVAPTQSVLTVVYGEDGSREAVLARFGLAPAWAKLRGGPSLFNARDAKLATSGGVEAAGGVRGVPGADRRRRLLRVAEARGPHAAKQPFYHRLSDGDPFAFAGLWTTATPKDAEALITSCSIITSAANREVRVVHDRMPVILDGPDAEAAWLSPDVDLDCALEFVHPFPDGRLEVYPVSPQVNNAGNEGL